MAQSYDDLMRQASDELRVKLIRHTSSKAKGPCPSCGGTDRLVVWVFEGTSWCSHCRKTFMFGQIDGEDRRAAKVQKIARQSEARSSMAQCQDWIAYHDLVEDGEVRDMWYDQGITDDDIRKWGLGFCPSCPTASEFASLTFPVWYQRRLVDIRHKLIGVPASRVDEVGKYRSHAANVVPHPYNLDAIDQFEEIVVVEGEKKPIILVRSGFENTVGIPGATLTEDLLSRLADAPRGKRLRIALDPGAEQQAVLLAREALKIGIEAWVADPFIKPDDMIRQYGAPTMRSVLRQARRVRL